jgi:hypothetical protein
MAKSKAAVVTKPKPPAPDPIAAMEQKVGTGQIPPIRITKTSEYLAAVERLKGENALKREIVEFFKPLKQEALKGHRILCAKENEMMAAVEARVTLLNSGIETYDREQRRLAQEKADRDAAEARAQEEARQKAEAEAAKKAGQKELAKEIMARPVETPYVPVRSAVPAVEGLHFRENVTAVVADGLELLRAITRPSIYREVARAFRAKAAEPQNAKDKPSIERCAAFLERNADRIFQGATIELVEFKQAKLNDLLKREGGEAAKIPGVEASTKRKPVTTS